MRKIIKLVKRSILVAILVTTLISCRYRGEFKKSSIEGYMAFKKDTILQDIFRGRTDIFSPVGSLRQGIWFDDVLPVNWMQADYIQIAQAAFLSIWDASPDGWNVNKMLFRLQCKDIENGLQKGAITFFKVYENEKPPIRLERGILILPQEDGVLWEMSEFSPALYNSSIDLLKIKVPAEVALQIAEDAGGREARLSVENNCEIWISLAPESYYRGWVVSYTGYSTNSNDDLFSLEIDPYTGKLIIIKSK